MKQPFLITALILGTTLARPTAAQPITKENGSTAAPKWMTPEVKAPRVSFHTFESHAAAAPVSYHIYTPAVYEKEIQQRFPVVYWLHGSGGGLAGLGKVASLFDGAIDARKVPPCFVVFVNGLVEGMYVDWKDGSAPVETIIVKELVPHIDATYRTIATREGRLLDGYSMGGYGAARLGFKYPELFRAISIMGGGPLQAELVQAPRAGRQRAAEVLQQVYGGDQEYFKSVSPRRLAEQNAEAIRESSLVRQVCGDQDETFGPNRDFHEHLERLKIPHKWIILADVDHNPMKTLKALGDSNWIFYRDAFGDPTKAGTAASNLSNRAKDEEISIQGGTSRIPLVRRAQEAPYEPFSEVVQFRGRANKSDTTPKR